MSAEKEVVNFWLNRKGYFTISNLKHANKDVGILALKFDKNSLSKVMHIDVFCSLTGSIDQNYLMTKVIDKKFNNKQIMEIVKKIYKKPKQYCRCEKGNYSEFYA